MNSITVSPGSTVLAGSSAPDARRVPGRRLDGSWSPTFLAAHWAPVLVLATGAVLLAAISGDQWLADRLYAWQGHAWRLREGFVTENLLHIGGRGLSTVAWLGVLSAWLVARTKVVLSAWRTPLAMLLVSILLATAVVAWIKSWSNMDCPWDLTRYGGSREFVGLLSLRPVGMPRAGCFPAAHASAGYAWTALYFFFLSTRPRWRWLGLSLGLLLGLLFGAAQQLRGAHFFSSDLWAAAICWSCAFGGYLFFNGRSRVSFATAARAPGDRDDGSIVPSPSACTNPAGAT